MLARLVLRARGFADAREPLSTLARAGQGTSSNDSHRRAVACAVKGTGAITGGVTIVAEATISGSVNRGGLRTGVSALPRRVAATSGDFLDALLLRPTAEPITTITGDSSTVAP